jgi:inositol transport system ATP-binding protein
LTALKLDDTITLTLTIIRVVKVLSFVLKLEDISKSFPGVKALQNVSFDVKRGEVHALMGENGAGKSTLMKIIAGIYKPDTGSIQLNGQQVNIRSEREAMSMGISMIHQELMPIKEMTVADNIFLGREPDFKLFKGVVNKRQLYEKTNELFEQIGIRLNPRLPMKQLSVAETQLVEISKAVSFSSSVMIMDEPTSALTDREVEKLFDLIHMLAAKGVSIIYISHKMDEIFQVADRITILRDGQYIGTSHSKDINKDKLITMMVGRELSDIFLKRAHRAGEVCLEVEHLSKQGQFQDISFQIRKGEILGIAGLMGAGRTELAETLFGLRKADSGEIRIRGEKVTIDSPQTAISKGIALVPEDRKGTGLNLLASVKENLSLPNMSSISTFGFISGGVECKEAEDQINSLKIKASNMNQTVGDLSGGNQQKVVIGKWLIRDPDILILDEPTRGIDIGAKSEIYQLINQLAAGGKAVVMISSEMPEIIGLSDRVIVLCEGRLISEFNKEEISQEKIMASAIGQAH